MPSYTAGTAFLRIAPSLRGLHAEINRELRSITPEPTVQVKIRPVWDRNTRIGPLPGGDREVRVPVRAQVDRKSFSDATVSVAALQRSIIQIAKPVAAAFAVPVVIGFATAVKAASGVIGLVPGGIAAAGAATAAYKVGVMGLADAFKAVKDGDPEKIAESMAKLSPAARTLVSEVIKISPAFKSMQLDVQEKLLHNLGTQFSYLSMKYLPVLRTGLTGVAAQLNLFASYVIGALSSARSFEDIQVIFQNTEKAAGAFSTVGGDIVEIFRDIATVGSEFLPVLAGEFSLAAEKAKIFVANARESGQLKTWIAGGIQAVKDFVKVFVNIGVTINNVLKAAGMDDFLTTLVNITQKTREWSESADGVQQIADLFGSLSDLGASLAPKLITISGTIIKIVEAVGPAIKPLAQGVTDVTAAAGPAVELFTGLAVSVLPPLGAALSFLAPVLGPVVAMFLAAAVASKAWAVATGILSLVQKGFAVTMAIVNGATMAFNLVAAIVRGNINLWATAQFLLNAAMTANPVGVVVVAIAALVAIIVLAWNHSETFRNVVITSWEAIKAAAVGVWGWLTDTVFPSFVAALTDVGNFFTTLWTGYIQPAWTAIQTAFQVGGQVLVAVWDAIVYAAKFAFVLIATIVLTPLMLLWNEVSGLFMFGYTNFIKPAWDGIVITLQVAWAIIEPIFVVFRDWVGTQLTTSTSAFGAVVDTVWAAIQATIGAVWEFLQTWVFIPLQLFVTTILTPMFQQFQADTNAAWEQIRAGIDAVWTFIRDNIWQPIVDFLVSILQPAFDAWAIVAVAAWETIRAGIDAAWVWIRDNIWNPIVEFITVTIPNGFQTGVDAIGRLWDGIKAKLRDPLQAAIDVVWNNGIVKVWNQVADLVGLGTKLSPYNLPGFAEGGPITGGVPNKDSVLLRAMPGEFIFSKAAVDSMGGPAVVDEIHRMFRGGGAPAAVKGGARGLPGYAGGGVIPGRGHGPAAPAQVNPLAALGDIFGALTGAISGLGRLAGGAGQWGQAVVGFGTKIGTAVLENLQQKVAAWVAQFVGIGGPGGGGGAGGPVVGGGSGRGFIIAHESGGNPTARNPSSTASGLYQMINGTWKAYGGSTATAAQASVAEQNAVADRYVNSRYGGWAGAEAFWRSHHWYDQGGMANGRGFMAKNTLHPERVLSNRQTRAFEALVASQTGQGGFSGTRVMSDRGEVEGGQSLGPGSFIGQLVVTPQPGDSIEHVLDTAMVRARHEFHSGRYGRR